MSEHEGSETRASPRLAERCPWCAALIAVGVFFGGGAIGNLLSAWLAPGSGVAALASFLALPAAFMISMVAWQGLSIFLAVIRYLLKRQRPPPEMSELDVILGKAWMLVPLPVVFLAMAGMVTGIISKTGFITVVMVYAVVGLAYGVGCYLLGRRGMLPLLED